MPEVMEKRKTYLYSKLSEPVNYVIFPMCLNAGKSLLIPFQTDAERSILGSLTVASKQSCLTSVSSDEHLEV